MRFCILGYLAAAAATAEFQYDAINVWPYPHSVSLCGGSSSQPCLGPHALPKSINISVSIGAGCGAAPGDDNLLEALAREVVELATSFTPSPRTYDEKPYAKADAFCPSRCSTDSDCSGGGGVCYIPSQRRWNSKVGCSPSSKYSTGCGCCAPSHELPQISRLTVSCSSTSAEQVAAAVVGGYELSVDAHAIAISAASSKGAANALSSLAQLARYDTVLRTHIMDFVPLRLVDAPALEWRGYMLDTSRHYIELGEILQMIDGMYAAKLNVFHWHVVDSPSFPLASASYPELANEGSWTRSSASTYSASMVAAVMRRAKQRFIDVVMEIDTPAHTLAVAKSHPEMVTPCWEWMATARYKTDVDSDDTMALDPTNAAARRMVATLLTEVATLEGASPFVHVGGDEVKFPCWNSSSHIREHVANAYGNTSAASYARLQAEWTANVSCAAVAAAGKRPVLWQPTTKGPGDAAWDGKLPADAVYMVWLNAKAERAYAIHGSDVVYTTPFYVAGMGGSGWTNVYNARIVPDGLTPAQTKRVLGAEVCMWGETMGDGNVDERAFQIGAAASENFWGSRPGPIPTPGPASAAGLPTATRYNAFLCHLRRFGIVAPPVMPSHCEVVH